MKKLAFIVSFFLISCNSYIPIVETDPVQDCYTFVTKMCRELNRCNVDPLAKKWLEEKMLSMVDCESVFEVADQEQLYGECFQDVSKLTCSEIISIRVPESCYNMFHYYVER